MRAFAQAAAFDSPWRTAHTAALDAVGDAQFADDMLDVRFHRALRNEKDRCDLAVGQAGGHQAQHLFLTPGQRLDQILRPGGIGAEGGAGRV